MPIIDPDAIFKKLGENRARMEQLGITENEMVKFYVFCGAEGHRRDTALSELVKRFNLNPDDAAFADRVLGECGPFQDLSR